MNSFFNQYKKFKTVESKEVQLSNIDYTIPNIAPEVVKKKDPYVWYGADNLYPLKLSDLRAGSGIHNSIIKLKTKMTAGNGFLLNGSLNKEQTEVVLNGLDSITKAKIKLFIENRNTQYTLADVTDRLAEDLQEQGAFALEVILNSDFTQITASKPVKVENLRVGKYEEDTINKFYYSRDWRDTRYNPIKEIPAFNPKDPKACGSYNQIIYVKLGNKDYYGEVSYQGGLTWIQTDFKMGLFHLSNIDNGMNPGMHFKFFKLPKSESDKQHILNDLKRMYMGALNTNRFAVSFSDGKDLAPEINPIQTSNLDKQLLLLAELCDKKIVTAHQLTSPLLAGLSTSGQLGGNTELKSAAVMFDNLSIESDRKKIERVYKQILDFNKVPVKLEIEPFNIFKEKPNA